MASCEVPIRLQELAMLGLAETFYRGLETRLDLSVVREWGTEHYADRGHPLIDPVVFFKLQLVMFFEGIRCERKRVETANFHLAYR